VKNVIPSKTFGWPDADYYEGNPEGFGVYSWSPEPVGTVDAKATQVHLHGITGLGRVCWRFKSPASLDDLIDALTKHREDVWGKR
jgi:hypothetical protein